MTTSEHAIACGAPRRTARLASLIAIATGVAAPPARAAATYASFDPPNSAGTHPTGINTTGVIAGWFTAPDGYNGFVRSASGAITTFDPGANGTVMVFGINASGATTGGVCLGCPATGQQTAFVRAADGTLLLIRIPKSVESSGNAINTKGQVAGAYGGTDTFVHGFVSSAKGAGTRFDVPGDKAGTTATAINDAGTVAGTWGDVSQQVHGFVRSAAGVITSFDPPNSISTQVFGIDKAGAITGYFSTSGGSGHSYIRAPDGTFTLFDVAEPGGTGAYAMNSKGVVAGQYNANSTTHGFFRSTVGKITKFDPPDSIATGVAAINTAGAITGSVYKADDLVHGYVRTP